MSPEMFRIVQTVIVSVAALAAMITAVVYYRQLRVMQKSFATATLPGLILFLESPEIRTARDIVRRQLSKNKLGQMKTWNEPERRAVATTLAAYNLAGSVARVKGGETYLEVIREHWGDSIIGVVESCEDFINEMRREEGPRYFRSLLWLKEQCSEGR